MSFFKSLGINQIFYLVIFNFFNGARFGYRVNLSAILFSVTVSFFVSS